MDECSGIRTINRCTAGSIDPSCPYPWN